MADKTHDVYKDDHNKNRKKSSGRFLDFLLVLIVVLGVVVFAAYRDGTGFDVLRRYLHYGSTNEVGGETRYEYDASASNRFAMLEKHLVILSDAQLRILSPNGEEIFSDSVSMEAPDLAVNGGRAVAYDVGGTELYVVDLRGKLLHLTADDKERFIAASLNESGWLTVTAEKQGYKGCVTVYDEKLEKVFAFNSSERFVMDACVTDDGQRLAAVTLGQEDGVFVSNVVLYDLKAAAPEADRDASGGLMAAPPVADYDVENGLVAAIGQKDDQLATVSDTCLTFAGTDGKVTMEYTYDGSYLRGYTLGGENFVALLLNRYRSGSLGRLVTIGPDGRELAVLDVNQEVLDISAAGRYLAVLYADSLVIYNQELQVYASLKGTGFANGVLMNSDGSALLLSGEYAKIFLP